MIVIFFHRYLLKVVHYEAGGESSVELKAKYFDTRFTSKWTQKAEQEEQTISIRSTVVYDVQVLYFTRLTISLRAMIWSFKDLKMAFWK